MTKKEVCYKCLQVCDHVVVMIFFNDTVEEQLTKQESGRWRLRFGSKKENTSQQEQLEEVLMSLEEKRLEVTGGTAEVWNVYTLPEIPPVPLSGKCVHYLS